MALERAKRDQFMLWLKSAHESSLLVYTRDKKSLEIARKLRPEMKNTYIASELNQALSLIEKHNSDPDIPGIDCIICDTDLSTLRLLDTINKRSKSDETKNLPLISTILLLSKNDPEYLIGLNSVGGANTTFESNISVGLLFEKILEVIHRQKCIEVAYKELKGGRKVTFPYFALFENEAVDEISEDEHGKEFVEQKGKAGGDKSNDMSSLNNWTYSSSMLPDYIKNARDQVEGQNGGDWRKLKDLEVRHKLDTEAVKFLNTSKAPQENGDDSVSRLDIDSLQELDSSRLQDSLVLDEHIGVVKSCPAIKQNANNLLDKSKRPVWSSKGTLDPEFRSFLVHKEINTKSVSVGGLNKAKAENCWELINGAKHVSGEKSHFHGASHNSSVEVDTNIIAESSEESSLISSQLLVQSQMNIDRQKSTLLIYSSHKTGTGNSTVGDNKLKSTKATDTRERAYKTLFKMANDANPDLQLLNPMINTHQDSSNHAEKSFIDQAVILENDGDVDAACKIYSRAIRRGAATNLLLLNLSVLYFKQKKYEDAIKQNSRVIQNLTKWIGETELSNEYKLELVMALYNTALCYFRLGNDEEALQNLEHAVRINVDPLPRETLALALRRAGRFNRSIAESNELMKLRKEEEITKREKEIEEKARLRQIATERKRNMEYLSDVPELQEVLNKNSNHEDQVDPETTLLRFDSAATESNPQSIRETPFESPLISQTVSKTASPTSSRPQSARMEVVPGSEGYNELLQKALLNRSQSTSVVELNNGGSQERGGGGGGISLLRSFVRKGETNKNKKMSENTLANTLVRKAVRSTMRARPSTAGNLSKENKSNYIPVQQVHALGLKELIALKRHAKSKEKDGDSGLNLSDYRFMNGFSQGIRETLFVKPSDVQQALLTPPNYRKSHHVRIITGMLMVVPWLKSCTPQDLAHIAVALEYRLVQAKQAVFLQNTEVQAMCVILKGTVQARLELPANTSSLPSLFDLDQYDCFCQSDLLFHSEGDSNHIQEFVKADPDDVPETALGNRDERRLSTGDKVRDSAKAGPSGEPYQAARGEGLGSPVNPGIVPRALSPDLLCSYYAQTQCELLLIPQPSFDYILSSRALEDFRRKFNVIKACGVFNLWTNHEKVRLARMGIVRSFKPGAVILEQGDVPNYAYFVVSGIVKVKKRSDRVEILTRLLDDAKLKAEKHDLTYKFHHKLRNIASHVPESELPHTLRVSSFGGGKKLPHGHLAHGSHHAQHHGSHHGQHHGTHHGQHHGTHHGQHHGSHNGQHHGTHHGQHHGSHNGQHHGTHHGQHHGTHQTPSTTKNPKESAEIGKLTHVTLPEVNRHLIGEEVIRLEAQINREKSARVREATEREAAIAAKNSLGFASRTALVDEITYSEPDCDITSLQWPRFFGEECFLQPDSGSSLGTICAETYTEIFMIHKCQLQTFHIGENLIARVKQRSIKYPSDSELMAKIDKQRYWSNYRSELMEKIPKTRWPSRPDDNEPFYV